MSLRLITMVLLIYRVAANETGAHCGCKHKQVTKYYVHDNILQKKYNTAYIIAGPGGNITHLQQGSLVAINDLIHEGPDPRSRRLGSAHGVYLVSVFFLDLPHVHQQFTSEFTEKWNGTIAYQGDDGNLLLPERHGSRGRHWSVPGGVRVLPHSLIEAGLLNALVLTPQISEN